MPRKPAKEFDPLARYFIGKFGKEEGSANLVEINKAFVLFALEDDGSTLTAIFSNTDVIKGDKWDYEEERKPASSKYKARERKRKK